MDQIKVGLKGRQETTVTVEKTARHLGSGGVDVFATPAMVSLMEFAALNAIDPLLSEGKMSVGVVVNIEHLAATPMGKKVWAEAEVIEVDRRRVTFEVKAYDEYELIGRGTHVRFVIDLDRYTERLASKQE